MKHFTIPIFVPELACPNRCVFCNQHSISGCLKQPEPEEVRDIILQHLKTIPHKDSHIEIGFFGGSFTGIEPELQERYLKIAYEFLIPDTRWLSVAETTCNQEFSPGHSEETSPIQGIRLSTRPDYISQPVLDLLHRYGVTTIELGAQSLDEEVLRLSGRGHSVADVERASEMIRSSGFKLGLQMMTGLPGDTLEKSVQTAQRIIELGASCTRIYPTLVIRDTELAQRWHKGEYQPQSLEKAVELSAKLLEIFRYGGVEVIRVGLHPSEGLLDGSEILAGPFHPSFRELVETHLWKQKLNILVAQYPADSNIRIPVPENQLRFAIGYGSSNRKFLEKHFSKVEFVPEKSTDIARILIIADKRLPLPAKNALKTTGNLQSLQTEGIVYKSISGHPDIFMCQGDEGLVVAPCLPGNISEALNSTDTRFYTGSSDPGRVYPDSARYNAVVTAEYIIHNLKITDPAIFLAFPGRRHLHVSQGYTRCNLLTLDNDHFITSDRGIEKVLLAEGKRVLYADPAPVRLRGQKYGFFAGCCGIFNAEVLISGSLNFHPQGEDIRTFIEECGFIARELYDGPLVDVGGIFIQQQSES